MSRIGKLPISIPAGVTLRVKDNVITVKGPKGELRQYVDPVISMLKMRMRLLSVAKTQRNKSTHSMDCIVLWFTI
jgi:ribosomal protein L6P/L9E